MCCIQVAHYKVHWQVLVNTQQNTLVEIRVVNFLLAERLLASQEVFRSKVLVILYYYWTQYLIISNNTNSTYLNTSIGKDI
jgi:hypothetical protein